MTLKTIVLFVFMVVVHSACSMSTVAGFSHSFVSNPPKRRAASIAHINPAQRKLAGHETCMIFPFPTNLFSSNVLGGSNRKTTLMRGLGFGGAALAFSSNLKRAGTSFFRNIFATKSGVGSLDNEGLPSTELDMIFGMNNGGAESKKKVLILFSDTGGGHKASALSLEAAMNRLYPGKFDFDIVDIWTDHGSWPYNRFVPGYQFLAKNPLMWKAFYEYGRLPLSRKFSELSTQLTCYSSFKKCIEASNPDLVISVHPLCQDIPLKALKAMGGGKRKVPFATVVTDLGSAHPTWFDPRADRVFVPSDALYKTAKRCGLQDGQIVQHGLPVREGFWAPKRTKAQLRRELGLGAAERAVLVVGGGDGVGGLQAVATSVIDRLGQQADLKSQVVVVCGKNEEVRSALERRRRPANVNVVVNGFVKNMDEWMGAVDCIITKAGPGTIAEAAISGLPCMLSSFLPGQEEGNIPYVIEGGYGDFSTNPRKIADTVGYWFQDPELLNRMAVNAKADGKPDATLNIARDLGSLVFDNRSEDQKLPEETRLAAQ